MRVRRAKAQVTDGPIAARRAVLEQASERLAAAARHSAFLASYSRMNPAARLKANAFYFGSDGEPPRAVILGPWLYIHAPGAALPSSVETITGDTRRQKHLGALHARVPLTSRDHLKLVDQVIAALRRRAQRA